MRRESGAETKVVAWKVRLENFRNYESADIELGPGLNVFHGPNAQGKTNLLESVHLVSTTRLLRGSRDGEAVREGTVRARVEVELESSQGELAIVIEAGRRKVALLNGTTLPRASDLIGRMPCVCVSQIDMAIVRGEPNERRLFLDMELAQLYPAYLNHLAHFKRSMEHRNALLRRAQEAPVSQAEFEPWEATIAEHGSAIRQHRRGLVEALSPIAAEVHASFADQEPLSIAYVSKDSASSASELLEEMRLSRPRDIARGAALSGPQRDDLALLVEERDLRHFGSQGQQRTAVLALKLATHRHHRMQAKRHPILLLDDILSDLDRSRRACLVDWVLEEAGQVILTCTEPEEAGEALMRSARLFRVRSGTVVVEPVPSD